MDHLLAESIKANTPDERRRSDGGASDHLSDEFHEEEDEEDNKGVDETEAAAMQCTQSFQCTQSLQDTEGLDEHQELGERLCSGAGYRISGTELVNTGTGYHYYCPGDDNGFLDLSKAPAPFWYRTQASSHCSRGCCIFPQQHSSPSGGTVLGPEYVEYGEDLVPFGGKLPARLQGTVDSGTSSSLSKAVRQIVAREIDQHTTTTALQQTEKL